MRTSLRKAYEITDARIQYVSLVDKAANKRTFLLKKADGGQATFATFGRILKADRETHYVTGVVYEPMEEDSHGNYMTEAEIIKAAYWFAKNGDKVDIQHSFEPFDGATVVENWIAKADFDLDGEAVKKGTWLVTMEVTDDSVWDAIEKGEITGFSMGGVGNYSEEDVDLDTVSKQETTEKKGLVKQLAKLLGVDVVEKGAVKDTYEERSKGANFWNAFSALEACLNHYDPITGRYVYENDEAKVREALEDFGTIITDILSGGESITKSILPARPIEKAGRKMSGKNRETLAGICDSLTAFLKEFDDPDPDDEEAKKKAAEEGGATNTNKDKEENEVKKQEVEQIVSEAIAKALGGQQAGSALTSTPATAGETQTAPVTAPVEKGAAPEGTAPGTAPDITPETVQKMVEEAITKAMQPKQESVTYEQVAEMVEKAVAKAVEPVLKSRGLPSNLGGSTVEKSADEPHYLHGIL